MMLGEVLNIGDKVIIEIPQENREWGYNPAPDGTVVEVVSFGEIEYGYTSNYGHEPGVYTNHSWTDVRLPNGQVIVIGSFNLEPCPDSSIGLDQKEYDRRLDSLREDCKRTGEWLSKKERLRDLPETFLWVGDCVQDLDRTDYDKLYVVGINYNYIGRKRNDGSDMPLYDISNKWPAGWFYAADQERLTLLQRGNVYKYYHKEPVSFSDIEAEARFYSAIGRTRQIRCPVTNTYQWESKEQVLDAIQAGQAHALALDGGMFGGSLFNTAYFYLDEEVGKRVAKHTLKEFGR
jgi:hypothetical protein